MAEDKMTQQEREIVGNCFIRSDDGDGWRKHHGEVWGFKLLAPMSGTYWYAEEIYFRYESYIDVQYRKVNGLETVWPDARFEVGPLNMGPSHRDSSYKHVSEDEYKELRDTCFSLLGVKEPSNPAFINRLARQRVILAEELIRQALKYEGAESL